MKENLIEIYDSKRRKIAGEKALTKAKAIKRKVIFAPKGMTGEMLSNSRNVRSVRSPSHKGIDHAKVLEMLKKGIKQSDIAKEFKVSSQTISYIKKKLGKGNI